MSAALKRKPMARNKETLASIIKYLILMLLFFFSIFPFVWIWLTALKEPADLLDNIFGLPASFNWRNFTQAWVKGRFGTYFKNSIIITAPTVGGVWWELRAKPAHQTLPTPRYQCTPFIRCAKASASVVGALSGASSPLPFAACESGKSL